MITPRYFWIASNYLSPETMQSATPSNAHSMRWSSSGSARTTGVSINSQTLVSRTARTTFTGLSLASLERESSLSQYQMALSFSPSLPIAKMKTLGSDAFYAPCKGVSPRAKARSGCGIPRGPIHQRLEAYSSEKKYSRCIGSCLS